jgi:hypothetical protein
MFILMSFEPVENWQLTDTMSTIGLTLMNVNLFWKIFQTKMMSNCKFHNGTYEQSTSSINIFKYIIRIEPTCNTF